MATFTETQVAALMRASRGDEDDRMRSIALLSINDYVVELSFDTSNPVSDCIAEGLLQAECGNDMRCTVSSSSCLIASASEQRVYFPAGRLCTPKRGEVYVPYVLERDSVELSESASISGLVMVTGSFRIALEDEGVPCVRIGRVVSGLHRIQQGGVKVLRCD